MQPLGKQVFGGELLLLGRLLPDRLLALRAFLLQSEWFKRDGSLVVSAICHRANLIAFPNDNQRLSEA